MGSPSDDERVNGSDLSAPAGAYPDRGAWERDLPRRHRYGDEAAFEELYREFAPMVYNLTLRMSGNPTVAEDLSQEVFLRIHRGLGRFRGRSTLKTWVYRISLNHCRSKLGRRRIETESLVTEEGATVQVADPARSPEDRAVAAERRRRVTRALLEVDAVFREALVLRDLEGLSYREIGQVLGARPGTVRSRISRGRRQLREVLERHGDRRATEGPEPPSAREGEDQ
jgi:RNA polymerase sigma-70 factor (ECF subfamily)